MVRGDLVCRCALSFDLAHARLVAIAAIAPSSNGRSAGARQTLIETLLFYHPAVWWVSRQIRIEREFCADDYATRIGDGPNVYASALASLGLLSRTPPRYAIASTGPRLVTRIRRILGLPIASEPRRFRRLSHASGTAGLFVAAGLAACLAATAENPTPSGRPPVESDGEVGRPAPNAGSGNPAPSADENRDVPRTDFYGDPLPEGAISRIGSIRLRHTDTVCHVAYSPDGAKLVCGGGQSNRAVRLWDVASGNEIRQWTTGPDPVNKVAFSPDGCRVAALCRDALRIWDTDTGELVQ